MQDFTDISYAEFKKRRPPWTLRFRRNVEYRLFRFGLFLGRTLSLPQLQRLGKGLGQFAYWILRKDRGIVEKQLEMLFPEISLEQRTIWTKNCFYHFGQGLLEFFAMEQLIRNVDQHIFPENPEVLDKAIAEGKGVILLAMHLGNWELIAPYLVKKQYPTVAVTTNYPESRINQLLREMRESPTVRLIPRGDPKTPLTILRCFKNKEIFLLAVDQDTNVPSIFVPFFGIPAKTPTGASSLALRSGAVIVLHAFVRQPNGTFRLVFERIGSFQTTKKPTDEEVYQVSLKVNQDMEAMIRRYPEQWAWFHRRWRHRPSEEELRFLKFMQTRSFNQDSLCKDNLP